MLISRRKKGMTLFEILVAVTLFSLIITLVASSFITGVKNTKEGSTNVEFQTKTRQTLDIMATELREAYSINPSSALEGANGTNTITFTKQDPFKGGESITFISAEDNGTIKIFRIENGNLPGTVIGTIGPTGGVTNPANLNDLTFKASRYSSYVGYESTDTAYKSIAISLKTTDPAGKADAYSVATAADQRAMPAINNAGGQTTDIFWLENIAPGSTEGNPVRISEMVKVGF